MATPDKQSSLNLAWGVHRSPSDASKRVVYSCMEHEGAELAMALDVAMTAAGLKGLYVGALIGKSEGYVSRLRSGKRPITEALVGPLCGATGTNLLRQVWDALAASERDDGRREVERLAAMLRAAA